MKDLKFWLDLLTAAWLVFIACSLTTNNTKSAMILQFMPVVLAFGLAMANARILFP